MRIHNFPTTLFVEILKKSDTSSSILLKSKIYLLIITILFMTIHCSNNVIQSLFQTLSEFSIRV